MGRTSRRRRRKSQLKVGLPPGSPVYAGEGRDHVVGVSLISYDVEQVETVNSPDRGRLERASREDAVAWVDVDGVHDVLAVQQVADAFDLHPLWVEDILHPGSRPKVEWIGDRLLVIMRVLWPTEEGPEAEHVAVVLGPGWVLSFQERQGDVWDPVRERIRDGVGRIRRMGADYLVHALMDAVVDRYLHVLEGIEIGIDALEDRALDPRANDLPQRFAELKGDLATVRTAVSPLREATATLIKAEETLIRRDTAPFFRDLQDHVLSVYEAAEAGRDRMIGALELHLAVTSNQLNEIMRVLTVVSTVFIPLSFVAGLYGMNFRWMPELEWTWGYPVVVLAMVAIAGGMLLHFRRRGWV